MAKKRRKFSKEFKIEAVRMLEESGRTSAEVCAALEEENRQLRLEVQRLKMEQEILKKAAAYFAKHLE